MKTYRQIRQSLTEVGADREEDQNFKLGPEKMSPTPSDEDEYDELDDDIEDTHQEVEAIRPIYVRDKLGHYTTASTWSSSGTMAQMTQQAATKNLQSEYVPEDGEVLDEEENIDELSKKTLKKYVKRAAGDMGDTEFRRGAAAATGMDQDDKHLKRTRRNRRVGIGRAVNRLAKEETIDELSKKTLGKYVKRAARDIGDTEFNRGAATATGMDQSSRVNMQKHRDKRLKGIGRATKKLGEETIEENAMDSLKKIVSRQTAETIRLADGSRLKVDMTTANALLGVHGALNIHNQKKMADTLNSNKAGFAKMSKFAFKQFGSRPGKVGTPNTGVREANEVIYTKAEREAAAKRAKANREKRAAERKKKSSNDDSDYDKGNYPGYWTDKDEEYKKIKSQIKELAGRVKVQ